MSANSCLLRLLLMQAVAVVLLWTSVATGQNVPTFQRAYIKALRLAHLSQPSAVGAGRVVLVTENDAIGSICPKFWTPNQAAQNIRVICSMLDFTSGGIRVNNTFGEGNKNFVIEGLDCQPSDNSLDECEQTFLKSCRPEDEELAISCYTSPNGGGSNQMTAPVDSLRPTPQGSGQWDPNRLNAATSNLITIQVPDTCPNPKTIQLYSSDIPQIQGIGNGYVQLQNPVTGAFEYLCDDKFTEAVAKVVCAQMCFPVVPNYIPRPAVLANSVLYPQSGPRASIAYECYGNETRLSQCKNHTNGQCVPSVSAIAGVQCLPAPYIIADPSPEVTCQNGLLRATFPVPEFPPLAGSNFMLDRTLPAACVTFEPNAIGLIVRVNVSCAGAITDNGTHIIYSGYMHVIWTGGPIFSSYLNRRYDLSCVLDRNDIVTNRYQAYTQAPLLSEIAGDFNISLRLELFENDIFQEPVAGVGSTYLVEVGSWINAAVMMNARGDNLRVIINDCNAHTSLPVNTLGQTIPLISKKCSQRHSLAMYPLDDNREGFRFRAFDFSGYSLAYIECQVTICMANSIDPACDRSCGTPPLPSGRRKRQIGRQFEGFTVVAAKSVDSSSILFYNRSAPGFTKALANLQRNVAYYQAYSKENGADAAQSISPSLIAATIIIAIAVIIEGM